MFPNLPQKYLRGILRSFAILSNIFYRKMTWHLQSKHLQRHALVRYGGAQQSQTLKVWLKTCPSKHTETKQLMKLSSLIWLFIEDRTKNDFTSSETDAASYNCNCFSILISTGFAEFRLCTTPTYHYRKQETTMLTKEHSVGDRKVSVFNRDLMHKSIV